jgi:hypothetical protein
MVSVRSITTPVFVRFAVSLRSIGLPLIQSAFSTIWR